MKYMLMIAMIFLAVFIYSISISEWFLVFFAGAHLLIIWNIILSLYKETRGLNSGQIRV